MEPFRVAVMSGKGGVGKSTVATQIACGLTNIGYHVGLVDLDVEGPNITRMLGITNKDTTVDGIYIKPTIYSDKLKVFSISNHPSAKGNAPIVWRGESHRQYIKQVIEKVDWGDIDYMVFDFPPGTGDAVIGIIRYATIDGLVLVSAPSKLSTDNCEMVIKASTKLDVPIMGLIENMSCFICPRCSERHYIFGKSNAKELAEKYGIKFYGEIPILTEIASSFDDGKPYVFPLIYDVIDDVIYWHKGLRR